MTMFYNAFNRVEEGGGGPTGPYKVLHVECSTNPGDTVNVSLDIGTTEPVLVPISTATLSTSKDANNKYTCDIRVYACGSYVLNIDGCMSTSRAVVTTLDETTKTVKLYKNLYGIIPRLCYNSSVNTDKLYANATLDLSGNTITVSQGNVHSGNDHARMFNATNIIGYKNYLSRTAQSPGAAQRPVYAELFGIPEEISDAFSFGSFMYVLDTSAVVKALSFTTVLDLSTSVASDYASVSSYKNHPIFNTPLAYEPSGISYSTLFKLVLLGVDENNVAHILGGADCTDVTDTYMLPTMAGTSSAASSISYAANVTIDCSDNTVAYSKYLFCFIGKSLSRDITTVCNLQLYVDNPTEIEITGIAGGAAYRDPYPIMHGPISYAGYLRTPDNTSAQQVSSNKLQFLGINTVAPFAATKVRVKADVTTALSIGLIDSSRDLAWLKTRSNSGPITTFSTNEYKAHFAKPLTSVPITSSDEVTVTLDDLEPSNTHVLGIHANGSVVKLYGLCIVGYQYICA